MNQRVNIPVRVIRPSKYLATQPVPRSRPEERDQYERPARSGQPAVPTKPEVERSPSGSDLQGELYKWREKVDRLEARVEEQRTELERLELALKEKANDVDRLQSALEGQRKEAQSLLDQPGKKYAKVAQAQAQAEEWQEQALRLKAEMENYRKRQQKLAADQTETERQRLLNVFLRVVDDLERALAAPPGDSETLREGVALTHRTALQLLQQEGVEPLKAENQLFDPNWHEAVATVPAVDAVGHNGRQPDPGTVIQVLEPGYRQGDRLLRPARVVVAVEN
jgi:molecular chaperone GrpE